MGDIFNVLGRLPVENTIHTGNYIPEKLLSELETNKFTGYMEVRQEQYGKGVIVLEKGKPIAAQHVNPDISNMCLRENAIEEIKKMLSVKRTEIEIYDMDVDIVWLLKDVVPCIENPNRFYRDLKS